jgi:hypothetical protein
LLIGGIVAIVVIVAIAVLALAGAFSSGGSGTTSSGGSASSVNGPAVTNTCVLLTTSEVAAALGEPVGRTAVSKDKGACYYPLANNDRLAVEADHLTSTDPESDFQSARTSSVFGSAGTVKDLPGLGDHAVYEFAPPTATSAGGRDVTAWRGRLRLFVTFEVTSPSNLPGVADLNRITSEQLAGLARMALVRAPAL